LDKETALQLAKDAYSASTTYVDANYRKQWEDALKVFQSRHPADSKYNSEAYKYRSKIFRPKTRSVIRKNEAAAAAAFFSNIDVVNIDPANPDDERQVIGAKLFKELLQHRLTKTIPWFQTLLGGFQDAMTVGVVASYQHWKYRTSQASEDQMLQNQYGGPMLGIDGPMTQTQVTERVLEDEPCIELLPVECLRIDRGANWTDPVSTSPYLIHLVPMYVGDLKGMARGNAKTGESGWNVPQEGEIMAALRQSFDSTRLTREQHREDSKDSREVPNDFSIVWVHKNIMRRDGEDWCFYTLGTEHMLSKPVLLSDLYAHGERPYVMGCAIIETHKLYPGGFADLGSQVQRELNEIVNARLDNVKLVMNKRYIVKRGSQVDLQSLVRNVAGSITLANDPEKDVQSLEFADVTGSSFQEQDRLNVDYDELTGNFSSSSVQTNRKLNETVGGMNLISMSANQLTEYTIRTFTETWVEPVLRQLVALEKAYETDETVLRLMGDKIGTQIQEADFDTEVELNVNVGMGATDPQMRLNKLLIAARSIAEVAAMGQTGLNVQELAREIFGAAGYRDGTRFMQQQDQEDPRLMEAMQVIQGMKTDLQAAEQQMQAKMAEVELKSQIAERDMALEYAKAEEQARLESDKADRGYQLELEKMAHQFRLDQVQLRADIATQVAKLQADYSVKIAQAKSQAMAKNGGGSTTTIIPANLHDAMAKLSEAIKQLPATIDVTGRVQHDYPERPRQRRIKIRPGAGDELLAEEF
jgi:hypothetical protein